MKHLYVLWCTALLGAGCNEILGLDADFTIIGGEAGAEPEGGQPNSGGSPSTGDGGALVDGGGGTAPADGGSGTGGSAAVEASCDEYCDTLSSNCSNANVEYLPGVCPVMCEFLTKGHVGDTSGDTVGCRTSQAELAATAPVDYCQAAGPLGVDGCAEPCDAFCTLVFATCSLVEAVPYASYAECQEACASLDYLRLDEGGSDVTTTFGHNLNCRLYHLQAANNPADPNAAINHCFHVGASGPCQ